MANKAPSFKGLSPGSVASSLAKRSNRRCDTQHELLLRRELWRMGLRFRKHVKSLPGNPDIVFPTPRVAVFCDGDFWHGRNWPVLSAKLSQGTNAEYWLAKIRANMDRDARNSALLEKAGWLVLRFWEGDIKEDVTTAAARIGEAVRERAKRCVAD